MRRLSIRAAAVLAAAVLPVALAACGGNSGGDADAAPAGDADTDCEPLARTGCVAGMKCSFVLDNLDDGTGYVACVEEGDDELGAYCEEPLRVGESDSCQAGSYCYAGVCHAICGSGGECSGGSCAAFDSLGFDLCLETCDALSQDCPDTPGGNPQGCYVTGDGPLCAAVFGGGGTPPGGPCFFLNDCEKGAGCFDPGICAAYCDIELCPPDPGTLEWQPCAAYCELGEICRGIIGEDQVGACSPP